MAMVKAVKGRHTIKVSANAFENIFKGQGYRRIDGKSQRGYKEEGTRREEKEPEGFEKTDEIDVDTIPVSDMDKDQLKEYARRHDIDISGTKNANEARKIIQAAIRNYK